MKTRSGLLISAAIRDVTERKLVEEELRKARILAENANLFKSRFLANMSHEIRTPLNAILGFAEVLKSQQLSNELKEEYLNYITSSGNLLLKLIGDVLDISKIEEGKLELVKESFHFKEVISSGILPYKFKANEKGLNFSLNFDNNIPEYVIGDSNRVKQVIINLIGNALKFTKEGEVSVNISAKDQTDLKDEIILQVEVSDTGIGIPAEKQNFVFESFTQADNSILREFGGSGLGLTIVYQLVSLMKGEVNIFSPCNKSSLGGPGTSVSFTIKLVVDKKSGYNLEETLNKIIVKDIDVFNDLVNTKNSKILVVEDNIVNQRLAKVVLSKLECQLDFATNGKEAVDKVRNNEYSLIFMDVQMPVMDGYEATKYIRETLNKTMPIIGLTANVFTDDIKKCLESGMNDYLGKPYNENQMFFIVNKWLNPNR